MNKKFVAKVIDNDSQNHSDGGANGRVQIYVPELHYGFIPEQYPWAQQDKDFSSFIPEIDDLVWVWFEDEGLFKKPFYQSNLNLLNLNNHGESIGSLVGQYPNIKYILLANGVSIALNSNETELSIIAGNAEIFINSTGEIHIKSGSTDIESSVLGETLQSWLSSHTHPTGVGPSGPPIQSSTLSNILSPYIKNN